MNATATTEKNWVEAIGSPAYQSIVDMVAALECDYDRLRELRDERQDYFDGDAFTDEQRANDTGEISESWARDFPDEAEELTELEAEAGECQDRDEALNIINEDPLSLLVRSGWYTPGDDSDTEPTEFELLLSTGGPAVRIIGELDANGEPNRAWLEVQDWGKPWTEYYTSGVAQTCLAYAQCFTYGR